MVMPAPNTARPITTVSIPLSRIADSAVAMLPAMPDAEDPRSAAVDASSPRSAGASWPVTASGPTCRISAMIWVATTTMVVRPSVAFGLARI